MLNSEGSGIFLDKANSTASWRLRKSWAFVMPWSKKSFFSNDLTTEATNQSQTHRCQHLGAEHWGTRHTISHGGRVLTVTPRNEHQNVGIVEGIAYLQGER